MTTLTDHPDTEIENTPKHSRICSAPWQLIFSCWLLMLICFTLPERSGPLSASSLDTVALFKLFSRAIVLMLLISTLRPKWFLTEHCRSLVVFIPLGAFVAWAVFSTIWSPLKSISFGQSGTLAILYLLSLVTAIHCRKVKAKTTLVTALIAGLLVYSSIVLVVHTLSAELGSLSREAPGMFHPTNAAAASSLGILLLVFRNHLWPKKWPFFAIIASLCLFGTLLMVTKNRTGFFMTLVVLGIVFIPKINKLPRAYIGSALAFAITTLVAVGFIHGGEAITNGVVEFISRNQDLSKLSGRSELWPMVWEEFNKAPWTGHGYFVTSESGELHVWNQTQNWTAHNLLLQLLSSTGIMGLILLSAGLTTPLFILAYQQIKDPKRRPFFSFIICMSLWYGGWSVFNASFLGPLQPESVVFFILVGLVGSEVSLTGSFNTDGQQGGRR